MSHLLSCGRPGSKARGAWQNRWPANVANALAVQERQRAGVGSLR